jgi:preprotein translocase subunit SecG
MSLATIKIIVEIAFIAVCVIMNIIVLMQEGKSAGLGSIGGVASTMDSYWSKNKGRSMEGRLVKATRILTAVFLAVAAILNIGSFS